jgi:hypothetical protein
VLSFQTNARTRPKLAERLVNGINVEITLQYAPYGELLLSKTEDRFYVLPEGSTNLPTFMLAKPCGTHGVAISPNPAVSTSGIYVVRAEQFR